MGWRQASTTKFQRVRESGLVYELGDFLGGGTEQQ